jgi:hypothetical protein
MNWQTLLPIAIMLVVVSIRLVRARKPQPLDPATMWRLPLFVTAMIGMGLWFQPHPDPTPLTVLAFAAGLAAGAGVGVVRARHTALHHDPETGRLLATTSPVAVLVLVGVMITRQVVRVEMTHGPYAIVAIDALMLFALAMIVTTRLLLWRRAVELQGAARA